MFRERGRRGRSRGAAVALLALAAIAGSTGCVERRYTIRTSPPGALVTVNGEEIGTTPVSARFIYYGNTRMTIQAEGHETLNFVQPIRAPWWDNIVTEFFTENLIPYTFRDEREFFYVLPPVADPPTGDIVARGEELRRAGQAPPRPRRGGILGFFGF
ncbi:hypothetical protein BH23PLA1_BH23PLA1_13620 [soil metagenome]